MTRIERMLADRNARYEDIMAAIDACAARPGADPTYLPGLHGYRLIAMDFHDRGEDEVRAALEAYKSIETPLMSRSLAISAACAKWPVLAALYLPPLVHALRAALAESPDEPLERELTAVETLCDRLGVAY